MRRLIGVLALLTLACGGESGDQPAPAASPSQGQNAPTTTPARPRATPGAVHEVKMELVNGKYLFTPSTLTIKVGDLVRWINVGGWPHNVQFKKDRIPAGAQPVLNAAMPGRLQDLTGPFLTDTLAVYEVSFANVPAGSYAYTCQPHEVMGMNATLTVSP